jgi:hypothetical protein
MPIDHAVTKQAAGVGVHNFVADMAQEVGVQIRIGLQLEQTGAAVHLWAENGAAALSTPIELPADKIARPAAAVASVPVFLLRALCYPLPVNC